MSKGPAFVVHDDGDDVGVAVRDLAEGDDATGRVLGHDNTLAVAVGEAISFGHKLALHAISEGEDVVKYGVVIGIATEDIAAGNHVHTHNVRSTKWQ